jgi:hypothetical protein
MMDGNAKMSHKSSMAMHHLHIEPGHGGISVEHHSEHHEIIGKPHIFTGAKEAMAHIKEHLGLDDKEPGEEANKQGEAFGKDPESEGEGVPAYA